MSSPMSLPEANGRPIPKLLWWLLTVVLNLLITGGIAWLSMAHADVLDVQNQTSLLGARMLLLEAAMPNLDKRLSRIEDKLDALNERITKPLR